MSGSVPSSVIALPSRTPACQGSASGRGPSSYNRSTVLRTSGHTAILLGGRQLELRRSVNNELVHFAPCADSLHHGRHGSGMPRIAGGARCQQGDETLQVGAPVMIVEPPPMLKTAEPMPMMRVNRGLIKEGDAGRIIDRRPKDVWAIRFAAGAYLIDRKYFKPMSVE